MILQGGLDLKLLEIGVMRWVRVLIILLVIFVMLLSGIMYVNYQTAVESHLRMWNARASIICQYINDGIDSGLISEATPTLYGEWGRQNNGNEYIVLYQNELPSDVFFHGSEKGNRDAYWCARLQENGSIEVWYSTQLLSETQLCVYTVKDQKAMVSFQINFTEGWINTSNLIGYYCNVDKTKK